MKQTFDNKAGTLFAFNPIYAADFDPLFVYAETVEEACLKLRKGFDSGLFHIYKLAPRWDQPGETDKEILELTCIGELFGNTPKIYKNKDE